MAPLSVPAPVLFLRDRFGGDFQDMESEVSVGTNPVRLVQNDPEAVALTIINTGSDDVYVAPSNTVSSVRGIVLLPAGSVSLTVRDDAVLPSLEWWAVAASAGQSVYVMRVRRYITTVLAGVQGG